MKRALSVLSILVFIMSILTFLGCSGKNKTITFLLYIDGCSCTKHSYFDITWDSPIINVDAFKQMLVDADEQGLLLCDCHEGKSDLLSVVESIEPVEQVFKDDYPGLRIKLKQDVWLYKDDIIEKLEPLFHSHANELFAGRYFKII